jgi:ribosome modulation factor
MQALFDRRRQRRGPDPHPYVPTAAEQDGAAARRAGIKGADCPHPINTVARVEWFTGWRREAERPVIVTDADIPY